MILHSIMLNFESVYRTMKRCSTCLDTCHSATEAQWLSKRVYLYRL